MFRNELVPVDGLSPEHPAHSADVKRLGDKPVVIEFASSGANFEVASRGEHQMLVTGPFTELTSVQLPPRRLGA
jgi:hypothetical protein